MKTICELCWTDTDCELCFTDTADITLCNSCVDMTHYCNICNNIVIADDCFNDNMWREDICECCNKKYNIEIEIVCDCYMNNKSCNDCNELLVIEKQNKRIEFVKNCIGLLA